LVMEYLEGETLAARLLRGPLNVGDLLKHAIEIADALNVAHQKGLVHRDLKPGNIMLTKTGAKLLDFGLAKSVPVAVEGSEIAGASTLSPLTMKGTIVGTLQYMAPEQLEGSEVDARSDIFAFGAVLHEMATGQKAFDGKTQAGVIAAILEREPPSASTLQPALPPALDRLIRNCLAKDPGERRQTMHDVLLDLKWISEGGSQAGIPTRVSSHRRLRQRLAWVVALVFGLATGALGIAYYRSAHREVLPVRVSIPAPEETEFYLTPANPGRATVSPDGRRLVFAAKREGQRPQLWVRDLDAPEARLLQGTEGAAYPFWAPDSRTVGFFADRRLKTTPVAGGSVLALCNAENGKGGTWNRAGVILFAPTAASCIHRVSAEGGDPVPVTTLDTLSRESSHRFPQFLPDGNTFLYLARTGDTTKPDAVMVGSLREPEVRVLMPAEANVLYASGHLLFMREATLMARRFDPRRLRFSGAAVTVAEGIQNLKGASLGAFSASENGVLVFHSGGELDLAELIWVDRNGEPQGKLGDAAAYAEPAISPDGRRVAVGIEDPRSGSSDIWVCEAGSGARTRFTIDPAADQAPLWSPDGTRIIYSSARRGPFDLYEKSLHGTEPEHPILETEQNKRATSWSPDGRLVAYECEGDVWILPLDGERKPYPLWKTEADEGNARFSPDGHWIAYVSDESGQSEVYVAPLSGAGRKWQVSTNGGVMPEWPRESDRLFYVSYDIMFTSVEVRPEGSSLSVGPPVSHFSLWGTTGGTISADGQRGLLIRP
ncbi:MAG: protein kinase, partial [Candidatus Eisenbacteria bacterium]